MIPRTLAGEFGGIDIYLFDQLLKGRIDASMRILDAGCGSGRNLTYLLRQGADVHGIDNSAAAIEEVRRLASLMAEDLPESNFSVGHVDDLPFEDEAFEVVLSSAVLHFAADEGEFSAMMREMWRVLRPGGLFFCRLASSIGMEDQVVPHGNRRFLLPDGTERFLVDEALLLDWNERLGAEPLEPLKTTIVQNKRCMTTWVLRKSRTRRELPW